MSFKGVRVLLQKFVTNDMREKFIALDGKTVNIRIKHMLYGNQKLNRCVLHPFVDEERIGFIVDDGEEKYITMNELKEIYIYDDQCYLNSDIMEIKIIF